MLRHVVIYQYILDSFSDPSSERQATTFLTSLIIEYIDAKSSLVDHSTVTASSLILCLGARPYYVADMRRGRWPASISTYGCSFVSGLESNGFHHHNNRLSYVRGSSALSLSLKISSLVSETG